MKKPAAVRSRGIRFNITPLIDIVFLLIIFFLVATHVVKSEVHPPVDLTDVTGDDVDDQPPQRVTVTIDRTGNYFLGMDPVDRLAVEDRIREASESASNPLALRIRADADVPYERIEPILSVAAQTGVTRIQFAVDD